MQIRPRAGGEDDVLLQSMDESGRGPRKAVAEAESSGGPTKYKQCWFLLLHRPVARDDADVKATPSATAVSGHRTKTMP